MQNLEVISVNLWQILISLCNLLILFLILKKFLYKPVRKLLKKRQDELDRQYSSAENDRKSAMEMKSEWENKLSAADEEADDIIKTAGANAERRAASIISGAKDEADAIVKQARADAALEKEKAEKDIRHEIASVSVLLSEKLLEREINESDHKALIDSFIDEVGTGNGEGS